MLQNVFSHIFGFFPSVVELYLFSSSKQFKIIQQSKRILNKFSIWHYEPQDPIPELQKNCMCCFSETLTHCCVGSAVHRASPSVACWPSTRTSSGPSRTSPPTPPSTLLLSTNSWSSCSSLWPRCVHCLRELVFPPDDDSHSWSLLVFV